MHFPQPVGEFALYGTALVISPRSMVDPTLLPRNQSSHHHEFHLNMQWGEEKCIKWSSPLYIDKSRYSLSG